jgi:hypothetical protein
VLAGVGADFPAAVAESDDDLVRETVSLLEDRERRAQLSQLGRRAVADRFGVERWAKWARELLDQPTTGPTPSPAVVSRF